MEVFEENNNKLVLRSGEKLYLDAKTADMNFVFIADGQPTGVIVPAHKIILSVGSPVFEVLFYGSSTVICDTKVIDASPKGFKEFLQIFYLGKVHLTSENIVEVTNLCKSYEVAEGLKLCENVLQKLVTIENICSRFKVAIDLELINFIKFCEEEITRNTGAILKTADFLKCNRKTLEKLLELMPSSCCASVIVVDSCLTWAKSKCEQKNLEPTTAHLKAELGELIGLIPFAMMNAEQFAKFIIFHKGLLNDADLEGIVLKTMTEKDRIAVEKEQTVLENETLIEEVKILKLRLLAKSPKNDDDFDDGEWW